MHPTTHTTLLQKLSAGSDPTAWREFCDRYGELIRNFARRRGLQSSDCDDVVQEVLLGLSKAMPDFVYDPAKGTFRGYLKTFVSRAVFKRFRQKRPDAGQSEVERVAAESTEEEIWEEEWRDYHIRIAMRAIDAEFGPRHRAAFESYAVDGRGAAETAEMLGLSVDNVYQIKSRILRRLTELIEGQVQEEG
jgi:RNA polymerase sigma-70 factor (ECF subfamily)